MPWVLCKHPDVLGVSGLVDRQLEHGADRMCLVQLRLERSTLGDYRDVKVQVAKVKVVAIKALVAVPGDQAHCESVAARRTTNRRPVGAEARCRRLWLLQWTWLTRRKDAGHPVARSMTRVGSLGIAAGESVSSCCVPMIAHGARLSSTTRALRHGRRRCA